MNRIPITMKNILQKTILYGGVLSHTLFMWNCSDLGTDPGSEEDTPTETIGYSSDIQPIFNSNCTSCHGSSGGLSLTSYNGLMAGGNNGESIMPGNGEGSVLVQKLGSSPPFGDQMPLGSSALSSTKIEMIITWIDDGAENN